MLILSNLGLQCCLLWFSVTQNPLFLFYDQFPCAVCTEAWGFLWQEKEEILQVRDRLCCVLGSCFELSSLQESLMWLEREMGDRREVWGDQGRHDLAQWKIQSIPAPWLKMRWVLRKSVRNRLLQSKWKMGLGWRRCQREGRQFMMCEIEHHAFWLTENSFPSDSWPPIFFLSLLISSQVMLLA